MKKTKKELIASIPMKRKYTKADVNNLMVKSLFYRGGTISENEAKEIFRFICIERNADLSAYFKN